MNALLGDTGFEEAIESALEEELGDIAVNTPTGLSLDQLNDAFNTLHRDVCMSGSSLCADVESARAKWREVWQSWAGSVMTGVDTFAQWYPIYQQLRARAVVENVGVHAPISVVSPKQRVQAGIEAAEEAVKDALTIGGSAVVVIALIAALMWFQKGGFTHVRERGQYYARRVTQ